MSTSVPADWRARVFRRIASGRSPQLKLEVLLTARRESVAAGTATPEGLRSLDEEVARLRASMARDN